jgi:hypothetical protein
MTQISMILLSYHEHGSRTCTTALLNHAATCDGMILGTTHLINPFLFPSVFGQMKTNFC